MTYDQDYPGTPRNDNIDIPTKFPDLVNETWKIDAKAGDDTVVGGLNNDLIYGKDGKDEIDANDGKDTVYGGIKDDTIRGGNGLDFLFGENGNDEIHGDAGDDRINGGTGADIMYGGLGDDIFWVDDVGDRVIENVGEGRDTVITSLNNYVLADNVERLYLIDDADTGYGNTLDNLLGGHTKTNFTDKLFGDAGGDTIYGYGGIDYLHGQEGNDTILGGDGNDHLFGGIGRDYIDGGSGFDIYYSDHGSGITADLATDTVNVAERIGDSVIEYTETIKNIEGIVATDLRRGDNLYGDDQQNTLDGRDGSDRLYGRGGNDNLLGGNWDDYLNGGDGNDILTGGYYHDTFAFNNLSEGVDTITDFSEEDSDYIQISKSGFGASSHDQFIYNLGSGTLYFDASPFDDVDPTAFAVLSNKPADFSITRAITFVD